MATRGFLGTTIIVVVAGYDLWGKAVWVSGSAFERPVIIGGDYMGPSESSWKVCQWTEKQLRGVIERVVTDNPKDHIDACRDVLVMK